MGVRHTETSLIIWSATGDKIPVATTSVHTPQFNAERWYDSGDKGCAAGPMDDIAAIMRQMEPGQKLEVFASDPTVPVDLSAWCRMTGHTLVDQQGNHYLIQHK